MIKDLHQLAMMFADKGDYAFSVLEDKDKAKRYYRAAFNLEYRAAMQAVANNGSEPTRSVLLKSAAALAIDCGQLRKAKFLLELGMAFRPPESIMCDLVFYHKQVVAGMKQRVSKRTVFMKSNYLLAVLFFVCAAMMFYLAAYSSVTPTPLIIGAHFCGLAVCGASVLYRRKLNSIPVKN